MNEAQLRELIQNGENSWLELRLNQLQEIEIEGKEVILTLYA